MITITTHLKNSESFLSDICFNQNKNKLCSLPSPAFFKILKETNPITETNNTSYKSPTIQLPGAGRTRAWHYHGRATPTSRNIFVLFLSEVMEAKWGWWNKNWMFYIKSPISESQKSLVFVWNVIESWKNVRLKCINLSPRTL